MLYLIGLLLLCFIVVVKAQNLTGNAALIAAACEAVNYGNTPVMVLPVLQGCSDDSDCKINDNCLFYCRYFPRDFNQKILLGQTDPARPMYSTKNYDISRDIWKFDKPNRVCVPFAHTCDIGDDAACNMNPPLPGMQGTCDVAPSKGSFTKNPTDCVYDGECTTNDDCDNDSLECIYVIATRKRTCVPKAYNVKVKTVNYGPQGNVYDDDMIPLCDEDIDCAYQPKRAIDECKLTWTPRSLYRDGDGTPLTNEEIQEIMHQYLFLGTRNWINTLFDEDNSPNGLNNQKYGIHVQDECSALSIIDDQSYWLFLKNWFVDDISNAPKFCVFDDTTMSRKCAYSFGLDKIIQSAGESVRTLSTEQMRRTKVYVTMAELEASYPYFSQHTPEMRKIPVRTASISNAFHHAIRRAIEKKTQNYAIGLSFEEGFLIGYQSFTDAVPKLLRTDLTGYTKTPLNRIIPWKFGWWGILNFDFDARYLSSSNDIYDFDRTDTSFMDFPSRRGMLPVALSLADSGLYCRMNPFLGYRTCARNENACEPANEGTSKGCPSTSMTCTKRYHTGKAPNYTPSSRTYFECVRPFECFSDSECPLTQKCTQQRISDTLISPYKTCSCQMNDPVNSCEVGTRCVALNDTMLAVPDYFTTYAPKLSPLSNVCMCDPSSSAQPGKCGSGSTCAMTNFTRDITRNVNTTTGTFYYTSRTISIPVCKQCSLSMPGSTGSIFDCSVVNYTCSSSNTTSQIKTTTGSVVRDNLHVPFATLVLQPDVHTEVVCKCPTLVDPTYTYVDEEGFCKPLYKGVLCGVLGATFDTNKGVCVCTNTIKPSVLSPAFPGICKYVAPVWKTKSPTSEEMPNHQMCGGSKRSALLNPPYQKRNDDLGDECVCKPGFTGAACQHVLCPLGVGGEICSGESNGVCDAKTGRCLCTNNFMGFACNVLYTGNINNDAIPSQVLPYYAP